jgi:DNA-directed RNA polymerase subunit M/transcription elongation factor TFIIS
MTFHLFKYICKRCGSVYKAPEVSADSYGEFLMRSPTGETVHLDAMSDPVFAEVDALLKRLPCMQRKSPVQLAKIQRNVFGVACDPDSQGNRYSIEAKPICQTCGNKEPSYWEATEPPEFVDIDVPEVAHNGWGQLDELEKIEVLERSVLGL